MKTIATPAPFTPGAVSAEQRAQTLAADLNSTLLELHRAGRLVIVGHDASFTPGERRACPQIHVEVRDPARAESRPEVVDG